MVCAYPLTQPPLWCNGASCNLWVAIYNSRNIDFVLCVGISCLDLSVSISSAFWLSWPIAFSTASVVLDTALSLFWLWLGISVASESRPHTTGVRCCSSLNSIGRGRRLGRHRIRIHIPQELVRECFCTDYFNGGTIVTLLLLKQDNHLSSELLSQ